MEKIATITPKRSQTLLLLSCLFGILVLNFIFRHFLENASDVLVNSWFGDRYGDFFERAINSNPLNYFLPSQDGHWSPTGYFLVYELEKLLPPYAVYYLINQLAIIVSFYFSWKMFRSLVFSCTVGLGFALTTHGHYAYALQGPMYVYLVICYIIITLYTQYKLIIDDRNRLRWQILSVFSLLLLALSGELWLDYFVFILVVTIPLYLFFRKNRQSQAIGGLFYVTISTAAVAVSYIFIKLAVGIDMHQAGLEGDLVFNYHHPVIIIEDIVSSWVTQLFMTITNFLPPAFGTSNSLQIFGNGDLIKMQNNYCPELRHMVYFHHLFFWRYFAGAITVIYVFLYIKVIKNVLCKNNTAMLPLLVFMTMVIIGSPTHACIKFRFYSSVPCLSYGLTVSILGILLLIGWGVMTIWEKTKNLKIKCAAVSLIWLDFLYCAFRKPELLNLYWSEIGIKHGPVHPTAELIRIIKDLIN